MADAKLSALAALAVEMAGTDEIYFNDGGVSKKQLYSVFKAAFATASQGALADSALQSIAADSITMDMIADIATDTFLGRVTAATGTVEVLTNAQAKTLLDLTGTNSGDQTDLADFSGALGASTGTFSGIVSVDDTTDSTSATTGSIHTDGGLGVAKDVIIGGNLKVDTGIMTLGAAVFGNTVIGNDTSGYVMSGGTTTILGGNLTMWGEAHLRSGDFRFRSSTTETLTYNHSAKTLTLVDANVVIGTSGKGIDLNGPKLLSGSGTPESAVTAAIGSIFMRTDGGAGTSMYVKESGAGNTGWIAK